MDVMWRWITFGLVGWIAVAGLLVYLVVNPTPRVTGTPPDEDFEALRWLVSSAQPGQAADLLVSDNKPYLDFDGAMICVRDGRQMDAESLSLLQGYRELCVPRSSVIAIQADTTDESGNRGE